MTRLPTLGPGGRQEGEWKWARAAKGGDGGDVCFGGRDMISIDLREQMVGFRSLDLVPSGNSTCFRCAKD